MKPFCEVIVSSVLPALRAMIADELMRTYNLKQTEVSEKLGITQPAISQYRRELRGNRVKLLKSNKKIMNLVQSLSHDVANGKANAMKAHEKFCAICKKVREEKIICRMHESAYPALAPCKTCFVC